MSTHYAHPALSRRTLAKGVAWAVPLVAATATVPAYASSRCEETNIPPVLFSSNEWNVQNPSFGKLFNAASNRKRDYPGGEMWWSMTAADTESKKPAQLSLSLEYTAAQGEGVSPRSLNLACGTYQMSYGLSAAAGAVLRGIPPLNPRATVTLIAPDGNIINQQVFTSEQGSTTAKSVPYTNIRNLVPTLQATPFTFTPQKGTYIFKVLFDIPASNLPSRNTDKIDGLGITPPTFTKV